MIVVDTSVWINHLRDRETPTVKLLRSTLPHQQEIVVGDIILLEVLQGLPNERAAGFIEGWLRTFLVLPMLDPDLAVRAGRNYRLLRQRGVTIRKAADLVIGTFCIDRRLPLLHDDRDFTQMEQHLGLQAVPG